MDNQKERDQLYAKNTKNLRFRTLNGKIKYGIHDLETKHESLLKLEEIARAADCLECDEEQVLSEVADNLKLLKKKEARVQEQLENDISATKGKKPAAKKEDDQMLMDVDNTDRPAAVEQPLTEEEEAALERFKDYEKKLAS